ncbi:hypothetical protein OJAV_G00215200 [Oryzias javanicus]|uniref:Calcipressin-3 n=1 Tax=Oryzias javanicus TaxID=123683 RepID=A0A437C3Y6_ORYJA|nr:hypothetical protein OJAV_G00215200 [Oryzias javanicus]
MLRDTSKGWSNGSGAYSSDPEEDEDEEEDMVFGESDQDGMAEEMMDLSDLPTALFACSVHEAVFSQEAHRTVQESDHSNRRRDITPVCVEVQPQFKLRR